MKAWYKGSVSLWYCVFWPSNACLGMHAWTCIHMVEDNEKRLKTIIRTRAHVRLIWKHGKRWRFLAFRSDSRWLVDTRKLVAPQQFWGQMVIFIHEPHESIIKNTYFIHFSSCSRKNKPAAFEWYKIDLHFTQNFVKKTLAYKRWFAFLHVFGKTHYF